MKENSFNNLTNFYSGDQGHNNTINSTNKNTTQQPTTLLHTQPTTNISTNTASDDGKDLENLLLEEQDTFIEVRDAGNAIAKIAKSVITTGSTPNILKQLNEKASNLVKMLQSLEKLQKKKEKYKFAPKIKTSPTPPLLARPRRVRKQQKKKTAPAESNSPVLGATKACTLCGTTHSVEWRRGPAGSKTLCNACGLYYAKTLKTELKHKISQNDNSPIFQFAHENTTPPPDSNGNANSNGNSTNNTTNNNGLIHVTQLLN